MITLLILFVVMAVAIVAFIIAGVVAILPFMDFIIAGVIACVIIKAIFGKKKNQKKEQSQQ